MHLVLSCVVLVSTIQGSFESASPAHEESYSLWSEAEALHVGYKQCVSKENVHKCYRTHASRAILLYKSSFHTSRRTNIRAVRRCGEIAMAVMALGGERSEGPVCVTQYDSFPLACDAFNADCSIAKIPGTDEWPWWSFSRRSALHADNGSFEGARRESKEALQSYMTTTGETGRFDEAWFLFQDLEQASVAECAGKCSLAPLVIEVANMFERFGVGCHEHASELVLDACREQNVLRLEGAVEQVEQYADLSSAATLLENAYRDCVAVTSKSAAETKESVLACWRTFGRRSLDLRLRDLKTVNAADLPIVEKIEGLASGFITRDMERSCIQSTTQPEVRDACELLSDLGRTKNALVRSSAEVATPQLSRGVPRGRSSSSGAVRAGIPPVLDTEIYDLALSQGSATPDEYGRYEKDAEMRRRSLGAVVSPLELPSQGLPTRMHWT